jgi:hypothetical protein
MRVDDGQISHEYEYEYLMPKSKCLTAIVCDSDNPATTTAAASLL